MNRRLFLAMASSLSALPWTGSLANTQLQISKKIPSSDELIPVIGMGTWITFNVGRSEKLRAARAQVLKTFFELGGGMVDSSPMYGSAQEVVGEALQTLNYPSRLFSACLLYTSPSPRDRG